MKVLVVGEYLKSHVGGAEKSTLSIIHELYDRGDEISIFCAQSTRFKQNSKFLDLPKNIIINCVDGLNIQLPPFWKYGIIRFLSRNSKYIDFDKYDMIIVYDLWGKALVSRSSAQNVLGRVHLYVRSETDYLVYRNYQVGWRRLLWYIRFFLQLPFFAVYCFDTLKIAKYGKVVSNSVFVQTRVKQILGTISQVKLPEINIESLRRKFNNTPKYVVFIGDSKHKGLDIFYELTSSFPELKFKCFVRDPPMKMTKIENVIISDWVDDPIHIYNEARLVIVPSQWEEAFGRVAREAYDLGVPVLCSKVGGLIEAVRHDSESLVENYRSSIAWEKSVKCKISSSI